MIIEKTVADLDDKEKDLFESIYSQFESMSIEEQKTLFKMLIFEWLECVRHKNEKNKKYWLVQASTYEMLIHLFSKSPFGIREFLFNQVEDDYKRMFESFVKA